MKEYFCKEQREGKDYSTAEVVAMTEDFYFLILNIQKY